MGTEHNPPIQMHQHGIGAAMAPLETVLPNNNPEWSIRAAQEVVLFTDQWSLIIFDLRHNRLHTLMYDTAYYICHRLINVRRNPDRPLYTLVEVNMNMETTEDLVKLLGKMHLQPPKEGWRDMRRLIQFHGQRAELIGRKIEEVYRRCNP